MENTNIKNLFKKWQEYLNGKKADETDKSLQSYSVKHTIQEMVDDHFIFKTFALTGSEMMKKDEKIYTNLFCSNQCLIEIMHKGHFRQQCLYIGKLIESTREIEETCSLVNLLKHIKKNSCHITRKKFVKFHCDLSIIQGIIFKQNISYYLSNYVVIMEKLNTYNDEIFKSETYYNKQHFFKELETAINQIHLIDVYHGDLKLQNIGNINKIKHKYS